MATTIQVGDGSGGVGTCTVTSTVTWDGESDPSSRFTPTVVQNINSPCDKNTFPLASGANVVTTAAGTAGIKFVPPTTNVVSVTLKGISGDTGIPLLPNAPFEFYFATPGVNTFVLLAGGTIQDCVLFSI